MMSKVGIFAATKKPTLIIGASANYIEEEFGKLANKAVTITQKGLNIVEQHLSKFELVKENELMLQRLRLALHEGRSLKGADASFYVREVSEAAQMSRGLDYTAAHTFVLNKYSVSPYGLYHPEVIHELNRLDPGYFNKNWLQFWRNQAVQRQEIEFPIFKIN